MKPFTHLFIDFENHQPPAEDFACLYDTAHRIWLFHGAHQNKFAADVVAAWQPLGERMRFVRSAKNGKNALDFHIAFALGQAQQQDAVAGCAACYVVVSRDNGFEALFDHMRTLGAAVGRAESIPAALLLAASLLPATPPVPPAKPAAKKSAAGTPKPTPRDTVADGEVNKVVAALRAHPANRPADRDALQRYIVSRLRDQVTLKGGEAVIAELEKREAIAFNGNKIEYNIPGGKT